MSASEAYHLKLATHLAILYADGGEFAAIDAEILGDFFFADRSDVAVLKSHVIKSANLISFTGDSQQ